MPPGVRIALGTDGNVAWAHHLEMEDMVAAGMTPAQVIVASTRNAAELLKMTDVGTVEDGQERRLPRPRRESAGQHHQHTRASPASTCAARPSIAPRCDNGLLIDDC